MTKRGIRQTGTWQQRGRAVAALLCLALVSAPVAAHADDDVDTVCGKILDMAAKQQQSQDSQPQQAPAPTSSSGLNQQKLQYCQAAKSAQDAADADSVMWKVWAGVAAVCTTACVLAAASVVDGGTTQYVCMGASIAGGVTDAVVSKSFMNALMGIAGAGGTLLVNNMTSSGTDAAGKAKPQKDWGSCLSAAMAGIQVYSKYSSMSGENDTVKSSLDAARKLADTESPGTDGSATNSASIPMGDMSGSGGNSGNGGTVAGNSNGTSDGSSSASSSACGSASANGQITAIRQCATADANLPGFFNSPKFDKEFKKDSGMDFGDFFNKAQSPAQAMAMGTGGALSPSQEMKLAAAVQDLGQHFADGQGEVYAGGGAGGNGGGGGGDMDMGAMMAGLMDQLNPHKKKPEKLTGVNAVAFANQKRGPAAVAEDRTLSIFDRVSYRYYFVGREILFGGNGK